MNPVIARSSDWVEYRLPAGYSQQDNPPHARQHMPSGVIVWKSKSVVPSGWCAGRNTKFAIDIVNRAPTLQAAMSAVEDWWRKRSNGGSPDTADPPAGWTAEGDGDWLCAEGLICFNSQRQKWEARRMPDDRVIADDLPTRDAAMAAFEAWRRRKQPGLQQPDGSEPPAGWVLLDIPTLASPCFKRDGQQRQAAAAGVAKYVGESWLHTKSKGIAWFDTEDQDWSASDSGDDTIADGLPTRDAAMAEVEAWWRKQPGSGEQPAGWVPYKDPDASEFVGEDWLHTESRATAWFNTRSQKWMVSAVNKHTVADELPTRDAAMAAAEDWWRKKQTKAPAPAKAEGRPGWTNSLPRLFQHSASGVQVEGSLDGSRWTTRGKIGDEFASTTSCVAAMDAVEQWWRKQQSKDPAQTGAMTRWGWTPRRHDNGFRHRASNVSVLWNTTQSCWVAPGIGNDYAAYTSSDFAMNAVEQWWRKQQPEAPAPAPATAEVRPGWTKASPYDFLHQASGVRVVGSKDMAQWETRGNKDVFFFPANHRDAAMDAVEQWWKNNREPFVAVDYAQGPDRTVTSHWRLEEVCESTPPNADWVYDADTKWEGESWAHVPSNATVWFHTNAKKWWASAPDITGSRTRFHSCDIASKLPNRAAAVAAVEKWWRERQPHDTDKGRPAPPKSSPAGATKTKPTSGSPSTSAHSKSEPPTAAHKVEPKMEERSTVQMIKRASKHGAAVAAVDEIGNTLVDIAKVSIGDSVPEAVFENEKSRAAIKAMMAVLLHYANGKMFDMPGLDAAAELQVEASVRDFIQPNLAKIKPKLEHLATLGNKVAQSAAKAGAKA